MIYLNELIIHVFHVFLLGSTLAEQAANFPLSR